MIDWRAFDIEEPEPGNDVLLIGKYPDSRTFSDVYHSWVRIDKGWPRWQHRFPPSHWAYINDPDSIPDPASV